MLRAVVLGVVVGLAAVFVYHHLHNRQEQLDVPLTQHLHSSYDYIIVGAGSAGCVVAARLSENEQVKVLLLEAGPDERTFPNVSIPGLAEHQFKSGLDWQYFTEPQKFALKGLVDHRGYWPRGRGIGGSSNLNSMLYVRGHRRDFDEWAKAGNEGWSYKDVLPYFLKSEDNEDDQLVQSGYHARGGPLKVSNISPLPVTDTWLQAGKEMGFKQIDPNGETMEGVALTQVTSSNSRRHSTSRAFLYPALHRDNLHVADESHVTKVMFKGKRAVGVRFVRKGRTQQVLARREVILSAGAVGSPQILQLSGVGPKALLEKLKIPVVADLPAGDNLQDHLQYDYQITVQKAATTTAEGLSSFWAWFQYTFFKSGLWASPNSAEGMLFASTSEDSRRLNWPDLQLVIHARPWNTDILKGFHFSKESIKEAKHRDMFIYAFACIGVLLRPTSRGTLRIRSTDPFEYPAIDPRYLEHPEDLALLVRGVRMCQKMEATQAMQSVGAEFADPPSKLCGQHAYDSDEYWGCLIRRHALTVYHPTGTCKMGPVADPTTVVDPQLRVKGLQGLRVADASIMPTITSGNTNAPVIMIGEKAADIIKASYNDL